MQHLFSNRCSASAFLRAFKEPSAAKLWSEGKECSAGSWRCKKRERESDLEEGRKKAEQHGGARIRRWDRGRERG
ncbi:hypothetical protein C1H46_016127 [Malus baccata]|uniref:Uncharacterized protein n=1 Tax=Malus baccata TaxID=106549 RepID=A0A540MHS2_MALBA|nr:hypothetical protein C1H46_016127 [Malus baccata]